MSVDFRFRPLFRGGCASNESVACDAINALGGAGDRKRQQGRDGECRSVDRFSSKAAERKRRKKEMKDSGQKSRGGKTQLPVPFLHAPRPRAHPARLLASSSRTPRGRRGLCRYLLGPSQPRRGRVRDALGRRRCQGFIAFVVVFESFAGHRPHYPPREGLDLEPNHQAHRAQHAAGEASVPTSAQAR